MDANYVVAGCRPWSRAVFDDVIARYPGRWEYVGRREDLTLEHLRQLQPRFVFFLHWSWKVPDDVVAAYECVCFHMTDVPYGRGGSPLQNLILAGHATTKLSALRMTADFDAGPVYLKRDLALDGRAQEIYERALALAASMIPAIIERPDAPVPQAGPVTVFRRRRPEESEIPAPLATSAGLYDFIRMLDADGYPHAFVDRGAFRYEFRNARQESDAVLRADVRILRRPDPS